MTKKSGENGEVKIINVAAMVIAVIMIIFISVLLALLVAGYWKVI